MKIKTLLLSVAAFVLLSGQVFADNIGYIDMEQVFLRGTIVKNFEKNIKKKRETYQKLFTEKQEKLEAAREKGKSDEDISKMIDEMEEDLKPKQEEIAQLEAGFQQQLINSVMTTAQSVAKEYGIDIVVDKRVLFYGGFDLTDFVLEKINE
jgi:outer membrane protein